MKNFQLAEEMLVHHMEAGGSKMGAAATKQ